jgi:chemotaxis protein methyltransferase CheR
VVRPALKRLVRFHCANLIEAPPEGGPFDVVLCRQVLMYFDPERARQTVQRLHGALAPDGWLLVGPVESSSVHDGFEECRLGGATFHRKSGMSGTGTSARRRQPAVARPIERPAPNRDTLVDALAACEATLAVDKCNPVLHYLHALLLEHADDVPGARRALRRALFLEPRFVLGHVSLARLCHREGRADQAQRHVDHAMNVMAAATAICGSSA